LEEGEREMYVLAFERVYTAKGGEEERKRGRKGRTSGGARRSNPQYLERRLSYQ
jgi:hypothetical protein